MRSGICPEEFKEIQIQGEKPRTVWVAIIDVEISKLIGQRKIAIVMSARHFEDAEDIDYLITNVEGGKVTEEWIVKTYGQRNWVEVFYREAKGWLGLSEYQVREKKGLERHFILVFCAYTFMRTRMRRLPPHREMSVLWHKLTGGLRRRWANKLPTHLELNSRWKAAVHSAPLNTFPEALEAFRTAIS